MEIKILEGNEAHFEEFGLPSKATPGSAALDLRSLEDVTLQPGQTHLFPLGFSLWIKDTTLCGEIFPRSGLGIKKSVALPNAIGLMDSDYQGEWKVALRNDGDSSYPVKKGERVAQVKFSKVEDIGKFHIVSEFSNSTARKGGWGHTGAM